MQAKSTPDSRRRSLTMVHGRYLPVIDHLAATHLAGSDPRDVYVVSHGAVIRLIASHLTGIDRKFAAATHLRNTGSIEIEYTESVSGSANAGVPHPPPSVATTNPGRRTDGLM